MVQQLWATDPKLWGWELKTTRKADFNSSKDINFVKYLFQMNQSVQGTSHAIAFKMV